MFLKIVKQDYKAFDATQKLIIIDAKDLSKMRQLKPSMF